MFEAASLQQLPRNSGDGALYERLKIGDLPYLEGYSREFNNLLKVCFCCTLITIRTFHFYFLSFLELFLLLHFFLPLQLFISFSVCLFILFLFSLLNPLFSLSLSISPRLLHSFFIFLPLSLCLYYIPKVLLLP